MMMMMMMMMVNITVSDGNFQYGWTPLHLSCSEGRIGVTKYLIQEGCDVNKEDIVKVSVWNGMLLL